MPWLLLLLLLLLLPQLPPPPPPPPPPPLLFLLLLFSVFFSYFSFCHCFSHSFLLTLFSSYFSSSFSSSRKEWGSGSALVSGNGRVLILAESEDIPIEVFHDFTHLLQAITEILPPSDHCHYHPNFSKFIMYRSSHQLMQHGYHKYWQRR